jgi:hypothetical protein
MSDRMVVVTDASAGVGRATALAFARQGASIGALARGSRRAARSSTRAAETLPVDVADADAVEEAAARIEGALGPIDVWVNNAMVTVFAPLERIEPDEFRRTTEVTFQPDVAAEAIVFAADHPRREVMAGWLTVKVIFGNAVAPGIADCDLADNGHQAQQTDVPLEHERPGNLFEPAAGDQGAHGSFDDRSRGFSIQLWATKNRRALGAAGAAAALTAAVTAATGGKK